jgi:two-component system chemotaxis response regulator CheY
MAKTILIVDDSQMIRTSLGSALQSAGYATIEAEDGQDATEKLTDEIDFIICDVNMPRMNGIEFLEKLASRDGEKPPVMMLTTEAQPELIREARALGAVGWIVKPCQPDLLVDAVNKLVA